MSKWVIVKGSRSAWIALLFAPAISGALLIWPLMALGFWITTGEWKPPGNFGGGLRSWFGDSIFQFLIVDRFIGTLGGLVVGFVPALFSWGMVFYLSELRGVRTGEAVAIGSGFSAVWAGIITGGFGLFASSPDQIRPGLAIAYAIALCGALAALASVKLARMTGCIRDIPDVAPSQP